MLVTRLARDKARAVAALNPDAWVIGSDQAAVLLDAFQQERILGKPGTPARCMEQLSELLGRRRFPTSPASRWCAAPRRPSWSSWTPRA